VRAGQAKQAELTHAQEDFVSQLAAKDRAYAAAIDSFRGAVTHITETPEGAAALAKFNNGDEVGALAILDQLNDARDAALQKATDIQKAVGRRDEAALAMEARTRGKLDTNAVIGFYQQVVKLDPGVAADWGALAHLYADAGRLEDAHQAALAEGKAAQTDADKATADLDLGDVLIAQRDFNGGVAALRAAVSERQAIFMAHQTDYQAAHDLAQAMDRMARLFMLVKNYDIADKIYESILTVSRNFSAAHPTNTMAQRDISIELQQLGELATDRGDLPTALKSYQEGSDIARKLATADPSNGNLQRDLAVSLVDVADTRVKQGDVAGAKLIYVEAVSIVRKLAVSDPTNVVRRHDLVVLSYRLAAIPGSGVTCAELVSELQDLERAGQLTADEKAGLPAAQACVAQGHP